MSFESWARNLMTQDSQLTTDGDIQGAGSLRDFRRLVALRGGLDVPTSIFLEKEALLYELTGCLLNLFDKSRLVAVALFQGWTRIPAPLPCGLRLREGYDGSAQPAEIR